LGCPKT